MREESMLTNSEPVFGGRAGSSPTTLPTGPAAVVGTRCGAVAAPGEQVVIVVEPAIPAPHDRIDLAVLTAISPRMAVVSLPRRRPTCRYLGGLLVPDGPR
jgi:hypothetical protein